MVLHSQEQRVDYEWIKRAAKQRGVSVNELIVLAPQNDPFYTGTQTDIALGQWFAGLWSLIGDDRMHIRRVHYWIVSQATIVLPNGKPYENTVECWDILNVASKAARYLELVDPEAFNDRRTPETVVFATPSYQNSLRVYVEAYLSRNAAKLPPFPDLPSYASPTYHAEQPYHLEVWCEKSTMNDVLRPLCGKYRANLQTGMGEMSITATLALVRRLQEAGKPARILYVSDFDPAGQSMPVAVSRKIEYFVRRFGLDLDIRLFPVILTLEQVQYYQLPRTPIKETERRRGDFQARHGEGAVELDALEALYPGTLQAILSQYIEQYFDTTLEERVRKEQRALEAKLSEIWQDVLADHDPVIQAFQDEYTAIQQDVEARLSGFSERLQGLWQAIKDDLARYTGVIEEHPLPDAYVGGELGSGLYNTERDYLGQIEAYKEFQGRV